MLSAEFDLDDGLTTSRDIDVLGDVDVVRRCAEALDGRAIKAGPDDLPTNAGIVLYTDADGWERQLDVLFNLYGVSGTKARETAIFLGGVLVLHPLQALEDKLWQLQRLRSDDVAIQQTRVAVAATRAFTRGVLNSDEIPNRRRQALKLNKAVFRLAESRPGLHAYAVHGIEVLDAVEVKHRLIPDLARTLEFPRRRRNLARKRNRHVPPTES